MKHFKYIISLFVLALVAGCSDERDNNFVDQAGAPSNLSALFTITQDNTGKVTIRPNGDGVTLYEVDFGDGTAEKAQLSPGQNIEHQYAEGVYNVIITASGINGHTTVLQQELTVTFRQPENLTILATANPSNPYIFDVTATADYETHFEVTFGDDPSAQPQQFNEGTTLTHTYAATGTYTITVTAFSGGVATATETLDVSVFDPLLLPVDFESPTLNYNFNNFGGANTTVVNNPVSGGINTSAKVAHLVKAAGSEVWAGSFIELSDPVDFSNLHQISVKTYAPAAGVIVKLKLENFSNPNINIERDVTNTVANAWETLTFDFTGVVNANAYQRVVLFYDFGNNGSGQNFYFDDIQLSSNSPDVELVNFQENPAFGFTNFGGAATTVVDNPYQNGINTSPKVAQQFKNVNAETWGGSFIELSAPISFAQHTKIKMKVWSPVAGAVFKFKLENLTTSSLAQEWDATTTVANGWEELTYDLQNVSQTNNYQRIVVFCDFGVLGSGVNYYFDEIKLSN